MDAGRKTRIVSLLPGATEMICELGLGDSLVGVSHECDHPPFVRDLPKVTKTLLPPDLSGAAIDSIVREERRAGRALYSLDAPTLERLAPDLIVTQTLCEVCAVAEHEVAAALARFPGRPTVLNLEPLSLPDVLDSLRLVAEAAGVPERAAPTIARLRERIDAVAARSPYMADRPRVVFLEWLDPPFCAGHWNPELIRLAGGDEMLGRPDRPSRSVEWDDVVASRPDVLVIACCGFDVQRTRREAEALRGRPEIANLPAVRNDRTYAFDGSAYFNRPGPRLIDGLELVAHALHPERHPAPAGRVPVERVRLSG